MKPKKYPVKQIVMITSAVVLLLVSTVLLYKIATNHKFVVAYAQDEYLVENEERLRLINIPESYLPYYNLGNVAFENGDYNSAIGYYTKALSLFPIGAKECDVRINLALSMCYSINFQNLDSQDKIDTALFILYKARDILLENGWANEKPELAKDADAQQLKEDIDEMIKKLENPDKQDESENEDLEESNDQESQDQNDSSRSEKEKRQQEKLEKNKKDAMEERNQEQKDYENWNSGSEEDAEDGAGSKQYNPW